jgi:predicted dehydrogenase
MKNIALIGCGNIGRRHLQGLLPSQHHLNILIVEPIESLWQTAQQAIEEAGGIQNHHVEFYSSINQLPENISVAIVATNADVRKNVVLELLNHCTPSYLILEKILFQKESDYVEVGKLLYQKDIPTYVNCTRRYFKHYQQLKKAFSASLFLEMKVTGSNWGLACNAIHLLDLFNYLNGYVKYNFTTDLLDKTIHESKRKGFIELTGTIKTDEKDLYQFSATSNETSGEPLLIQLKSEHLEVIINETEGKIESRKVLLTEDSEKPIDLNFTFQALPLSKAAYLFIDDLLSKGKCDLTDYFTSAQLHLTLLKSYLTHLRNQNFEIKNNCCPIT